MVTINPYLNFLGNTEDAFNFYKSVFGGKFTTLQRFKDMPGGDKIPAGDQNKILHIALPIGKNVTLMATDALDSLGQSLTLGNNLHIAISSESKAEANKLFNALSAGGKIEMPLEDMPWGAYFGSFADKYGVQWMVTYEHKKN